jgi:hypothetical protein
MRTKTNTLLLTFLVLAFFELGMSSCGLNYTTPEPTWKTDTILPPITTTGTNTFGCKYNGVYWLAVSSKKISGSYSNGAISILMEKSGDGKTGAIILSCNTKTIYKEGMYEYNDRINGKYFGSDHIFRTIDSNNTGYLNILRLDSINRILSGTFEFRAYVDNINSKSVSITLGRFDFKY